MSTLRCSRVERGFARRLPMHFETQPALKLRYTAIEIVDANRLRALA
jgi:hypothetical protein